MKKVTISKRQVMTITLGFMLGTAPLLVSSDVAASAGPNSWISAIIAAIIGLPVVWINTYLGGLYPEQTLVDIIVLLLGKWLGGFIAVCFIFTALHFGTQVIWCVGDFFQTVSIPQFPAFPINTLFIIVTAIALLYGLEAFSRANEIFYVIALPLYMIAALMLIPDIKADNLLPVFENGIFPVLQGAVPLLNDVILPIIFLNMVFPMNTGNAEETKKYMFKGYIIGILITFIAVVLCILIFGSTITANLRFPLFVLTRNIRLGGVLFLRLEAMFIILWMITNFVSTFLYIYAGIVGLSRLLGLKSYKTIVLPILLIVSAYSDTIYKNVPYQTEWDLLVLTPYIFTFGLILPVVLLIISRFKKVGWNAPPKG
jgi:spore germination protein KB